MRATNAEAPAEGWLYVVTGEREGVATAPAAGVVAWVSLDDLR